MPFYEKADVRIRYEEAGSGFPLLLIPGGGVNSTIAFFTGNAPFNAIEAFKDEYRVCLRQTRHHQGAGTRPHLSWRERHTSFSGGR
jgi:hypothetical protein